MADGEQASRLMEGADALEALAARAEVDALWAVALTLRQAQGAIIAHAYALRERDRPAAFAARRAGAGESPA